MFGLPRGTQVKTPDQLRAMRRAGLVVAEALAACEAAARPGMTTRELDAVAAEVIARRGAVSAFIGYGTQWGMPPYPACTCISVNEEIVHGIPGERVLSAGDLVSVDFAVSVDGWFADAARTFGVGAIADEARELSAATRRSLWAGLSAARVGRRLGDVEHAIQRSIESEPVSYGIVEEYTGHGIGQAMHQPPDVFNFGKPGRGPRLVAGLALAIEPMITLGSEETITLADEWTVATKDGSLASHWEHTVALTAQGLWVLTAEDGGEAELTALGAPFAPLGD